MSATMALAAGPKIGENRPVIRIAIRITGTVWAKARLRLKTMAAPSPMTMTVLRPKRSLSAPPAAPLNSETAA